MHPSDNRSSKTDKKSGGFSLIEMIITIAVLSIGMVGVMMVFVSGITRSSNPVIIEKATQLAQGELDSVIGLKHATDFFNASLNTGTGLGCKTAAAMLANYSCSLDICYVAQGTPDNTASCTTLLNPKYKRVAVTITYQPTGDSVKAVTLLSIVND